MNQYLKKITNTVNYIEDHLTDSVLLKDISKEAGFSSYHLHHIFKSITGKSLMKYVKARQLSKSTGELLNTDLSLLDIALEYGFEHQQSYSRAFKKQFGIPPSYLRKDRTTVYLEPIIDLNTLHSIEDGILIKPNYIIKTEFYTVGLKYKVFHNDNFNNSTATQLANDFFEHHRTLIPNIINPNIYIALVNDVPQEADYAYYIPSTEVSNIPTEIPNGMVAAVIPSRRYAVFKYIGMHSANEITYRLLTELYRYIFEKYLFESGDKKRDFFHFERIDLDVCRDDYCELEIYVPILDSCPLDHIRI